MDKDNKQGENNDSLKEDRRPSADSRSPTSNANSSVASIMPASRRKSKKKREAHGNEENKEQENVATSQENHENVACFRNDQEEEAADKSDTANDEPDESVGAFAISGQSVQRRTLQRPCFESGEVVVDSRRTMNDEMIPEQQEQVVPVVANAVVAQTDENLQARLDALEEQVGHLRDPQTNTIVPAQIVASDQSVWFSSMAGPSTTTNTESHDDRKRKRRRFIVLILLAVLIAVGATVAVMLTIGDGSGGDSSPATNPVNQTTDPPSPVVTNAPATPAATMFPTTPAPTTAFPTSNPTAFPTATPSERPSPVPEGPFWKRLGQELEGRGTRHRKGHAVSLSRDATTVAVTAPETDALGYVAVYNFDASSSLWIPKGQELVGGAVQDLFGWSVELSGNGNILAVGARSSDSGGVGAGHVCVYEYQGFSWIQLGQVLVGAQAGDGFGEAVSLSDSGDILAVGAWENDRGGPGSVRVYQLNRTMSSWQQLGQTLVGQADAARFGSTVSLSNSGLIVAVGAHKIGAGAEGQVSVYNFSSAVWMQIGGALNGDRNGERFGFSVSLSESGLEVAVGSRWGKSEQRGSVTVYDHDTSASTWTQRGQTLEGVAPMDFFGWSVSLSDNGNIVAAGARGNDDNGNRTGHVRIFEYRENSWGQLGSDLRGVDPFEEFGKAISLGGTSTPVVAIGGPFHNNETGRVEVYSLN